MNRYDLNYGMSCGYPYADMDKSASGEWVKFEEIPQWKPIETAPRDGTEYIATDGQICTVENHPEGYMPGTWTKDGNKWSGYASRHIGYSPTHWIPLPEPPK